jgi:hypothetical protein
MIENSIGNGKRKTRWSACPNCLEDLGTKPVGHKPPHTYCPHCGVALVPIWWQRYLFATIGVILSLVFPAILGIRDIMGLLLAGLLCVYPAIIFAYILVFKMIPPKYVTKDEVLTLFHR